MNRFDKIKQQVLNAKIDNDCEIGNMIEELNEKYSYVEQLKELEIIKDKIQQSMVLDKVLHELEDYRD